MVMEIQNINEIGVSMSNLVASLIVYVQRESSGVDSKDLCVLLWVVKTYSGVY